VRRLRETSPSAALYPIERCWLRLLITIVVVGPVLAAAGLGGTLFGLAVFLVIFAVVATTLITHELRPAVRLSSGMNRSERAPRA
jgi:hypothetical protein